MMIEIQETPDANVINFFPPQPLLKQGSAEFVDTKSTRKSPLAEQIFDIGGIASLFITADMISVTKQETASWEDIKPIIMAEIMDYLSTGEDIMTNETADNDVTKQVKALLDARIRPAVKKDGGDIKFISFENGVVLVEMQGACKGCPYAMRTLKEGVERILKTYISEVKEVRNIEENNE
jgi:Fe-S cluster biogenesis protein NfuA